MVAYIEFHDDFLSSAANEKGRDREEKHRIVHNCDYLKKGIMTYFVARIKKLLYVLWVL
jgi:hypothetical protein